MRKRHILIATLLIILVCVFYFFYQQNKTDNIKELTTLHQNQSTKELTKVNLGGRDVQLEVARTTLEQQKGLCCRDNLPTNRGMLFVYDKPVRNYFWMKDTKIPLDIIWLDQDKKIIHIEHSVQPSSYPASFGPDADSHYVIELNAGFALQNNVAINQLVEFSL